MAGKENNRVAKNSLLFVVHKHKATALHYDFRLEIGGVMPSWSIPKGPTLDPKVKRLAMPTGDHALEYRKFEGVWKGYTGRLSTVMIWDEGEYVLEREISKGVRQIIGEEEDANEFARKSVEEGNLKFTLHGKKLHGSFALVRTKGIRGKESWLLIKHRDDYCVEGYDANSQDFSAVSGLSLAELTDGHVAKSSNAPDFS